MADSTNPVMAALVRAAEVVRTGCPTAKATGQPCAGCEAAAKRVLASGAAP